MKRLSNKIIEDFGGVSELSRLVKAPTSTVNSWRDRITDSRLDHLRLAAKAARIRIDWSSLEDATARQDAAA